MKFSVGIPGISRFKPAFDPWMAEMKSDDIQHLCRSLEAMGYGALESPEHLAVDASLVENMGASWPHSITAIAFYAGATRTARVNTRVTVLPLHHPVSLAKQITTLDYLSSGRVTVTFGVGHGEAEFRALGVDHSRRGEVADEYLDAMRVLWTEERPSFKGKYVQFDGVAFEPKPIQKPYPPIWIGGNSKAALRRALKYGVGWRPWAVNLEDLPQWLDTIAAMPESAGRKAPLEFHLPVKSLQVNEDHTPLDGKDGRAPELPATQMLDRIGRMEELGVTWATLPHSSARSLQEYLDKMQAQAEALMDPTMTATTTKTGNHP